jgi:hypothetical protein
VRFVIPEIEGCRQLSIGIYKLDAVLLDEVALFHLVQHAEPLKDPVGFRDKRVTNMKAGEIFSFE